MDPLISLKKVVKSFGSLAVHQGITFDILPGEVLTLMGPSGTGKTVLLKLILGLLKPDQGEVYVLGQEITNLEEYQLSEIRKNIGMLFQGAALFDSLTIFDNVAYPLVRALAYEKKLSTSEVEAIVNEKLNLVGLPNIQDKLPGALSGGQRKRVGLARALATSPTVLLFDEPTTGLDPTSRCLIDNLIIQLRNEYSISSLVVTHDMESAYRISDRIVLISEGTVIAAGDTKQLWSSNEDVRRFVSGNWPHP